MRAINGVLQKTRGDIVGLVLVGRLGTECLVVEGEDRLTIRSCRLRGGSTVLRCIDCTDVTVIGNSLECPDGPADPDGHLIQFIRSTGTIEANDLTQGPGGEDGVNIFADQAVIGVVTVVGNTIRGRGLSNSGCQVTLDGLHCPPTAVYRNHLLDGRCALTAAGGGPHRIDANVMAGNSAADVYIEDGYGRMPDVWIGRRNKMTHPVMR